MQPTILPTVALIGLPNAGKSSIINRLVEGRPAIVAAEAHTTRDLNYGECEWEDNYFRVVDTGGLVPDPEDKIQKAVQVTSWAAIAQADLLIWVIDRRQNPDTISLKIIQKVWKTGKPVFIVINKVDDPNSEKGIAEYAKLGGEQFLNVSCNSGYNLGTLCDLIIEKFEKLGFTEAMRQKPEMVEIRKPKPKADKRLKNIEKKLDGTYIVRGTDGIFEAVMEKEQAVEDLKIDNIIFDWYRVCFDDGIPTALIEMQKKYGFDEDVKKKLKEIYEERQDETINREQMIAKVNALLGTDFKDQNEFKSTNWTQIIPSTFDFIKAMKAQGKKIYYITNITDSLDKRRESEIYPYFDGGLASCEVGLEKPNPEIYQMLWKKYKLKPAKSWFIDDKERNVTAATKIGLKGLVYIPNETNLFDEIKIVEKKDPKPPSIFIIGKPNVGKSSLFNALAGSDIQIVTDIAGTTLSVNDTLLERKVRKNVVISVKKRNVEPEATIEAK